MQWWIHLPWSTKLCFLNITTSNFFHSDSCASFQSSRPSAYVFQIDVTDTHFISLRLWSKSICSLIWFCRLGQALFACSLVPPPEFYKLYSYKVKSYKANSPRGHSRSYSHVLAIAQRQGPAPLGAGSIYHVPLASSVQPFQHLNLLEPTQSEAFPEV